MIYREISLWVERRHLIWRFMLLVLLPIAVLWLLWILTITPTYAKYSANREKVLALEKKIQAYSDNNSGRPIYKDELLAKTAAQRVLNVLLDSSGARVMRFQREPPVKVGSVYKHVFQVKLNTSYFDFLKYLHTIKQLNLPVYYEHMKYSVTKYPHATVNLRVFTLMDSA